MGEYPEDLVRARLGVEADEFLRLTAASKADSAQQMSSDDINRYLELSMRLGSV
jgi:hypothetical protein